MSRVRILICALACLLAAPASAGTGPFTYRAVVSKFGVLNRHGGGAVSAEMASRGQYVVSFVSNVDTCTIVATLGRATTDGGQVEKPGFISAAPVAANSNLVAVYTRDMRGRPRDYAFHLLVACP